ncbi:MAG TPA: methyltransferase domain-containing protein [Thermomicrobiales bacterium]|nr:methyltransferase domain-containing protein [Thermomicrobiales bacterium]
MTDAQHLRLEAWDRTPPGEPAQVELNRHGVALRDIPWKATTDAGVVSVSARQLPFADGAFQRLMLADLLEYVRDERAVLAEIARVLAPNSRLTVLVPHHGPTTWLDGANWHRYLHDLGGSESLLPELAESGWRRRYRRSDLEALLTESGFALGSVEQRGTGLSELGWFIGRLLQEKRPPVSVSANLDLIRIRYTARSLDRRVPLGSLGAWLIVEAVKA